MCYYIILCLGGREAKEQPLPTGAEHTVCGNALTTLGSLLVLSPPRLQLSHVSALRGGTGECMSWGSLGCQGQNHTQVTRRKS